MNFLELLQQHPQYDGVMCLPLSRDKDRDIQYVKNFELDTRNQKIRILLLGPVGAGKSSFINSVNGVLRGRTYTQAGVDNISEGSYTKTVRRTLALQPWRSARKLSTSFEH